MEVFALASPIWGIEPKYVQINHRDPPRDAFLQHFFRLEVDFACFVFCPLKLHAIYFLT